ncbi:MAG: Ornithine aminotransferase 2 [Candidatus Heimdallarchaeota archaeon LC_2]|nr:MAG: Ornithine aminotransferase 2 [Candidatus Heimdallarchaeota archaeon LC_2]
MVQMSYDSKSEELMAKENKVVSPNYTPIPVVLSHGDGIYVTDVDGKKYIDCLSAYSAVNQGHLHPKIISAAEEQMKRITLTSRAFYNDQLGDFIEKLCNYSGMEMACPMNTGAEAVETGIKVARRWGYRNKKVEANKAEIIVCDDNFHGRTTTIVGFSSDPDSYEDFGPYPEGFKSIPFGDLAALETAITSNTVAFLVEPIQGEAGVIVPPEGYLKGAYDICKKNNVLLIADEIQTGFARTGKNFCFEFDEIKPDLLLVGKALGGGLMPISATLGTKEIMSVLTSGSHGSTFGGNPLACAIGSAAIDVLVEEDLANKSMELGKYFLDKLKDLPSEIVKDARGRGLLVAIEFKERGGKAKKYVMEMKSKGLLAKQTHDTIIRFAPPLVITKDQVDDVVQIIQSSIASVASKIE